MAGLEEKFSQSPSNSPNLRASLPSRLQSSFSGENNENYLSPEQMKSVEKSSTASAASKVAVEKNILVERNTNLSSAYGEAIITRNLEQERIVRNSSGSGNQADRNRSTRPRYLRFNPNRRREILSRLEKLAKEETNDLVVLSEENLLDKDTKDCSINSVEVSVKENEEISEEEEEDVDYDSDEEDVEFEEARGWCLGRVLKVMFALIACFVSKSCIFSMNSYTTPTPYCQNRTLEINDKEMEYAGFSWETESYLGLMDKVDIVENVDWEIKEQVMVESFEDGDFKLDGLNEVLVGSNEVIADVGGEVENMVALDDVEVSEYKDYEENVVSGGGIEPEIDAFQIVFGAETFGDGDVNLDSQNEVLVGSNEVIADMGGLVVEVENMVALDNVEVSERKDYKENVASGLGIEPETDASQIVFCAETVVLYEEAELEKEKEDSGKYEELELLVNSNNTQEKESAYLRGLDGMESIEESNGDGMEPVEESNGDGMEPVEESNGLAHEVEFEQDINIQAESEKAGLVSLFLVAGVLSLCMMLLALYHHSAKATKPAAECDVLPNIPVEPLTMERKVEFLAPTSRTSLVKEVSKSRYAHVPMVQLLAPASRTSLVKEVSRSRYEHVPVVELLGEVVLAGPSISSQAVAAPPTHPASSKPLTSSGPQLHEINTVRKTSKKEGGKTGKSMICEATPVRRSSRLRSRAAVVSP